MTEINRFGSGERGSWYWNKETEKFELCKPKPKVITHFIQTDAIDPVESYATSEGRIFDSRSALDRHYKEHGFERCSKEDLKPKPKAPKEIDMRAHREQWERAENDVRWGNVELSEWEREVCRRENEMMESWKNGSRPDHLAKKLTEH